MSFSVKPSKATFPYAQFPGSPLSAKMFVTPVRGVPGSSSGHCAGSLLVHYDREFFSSASSVQRAEPGPQQGLCCRTVCRRNMHILLSVVPSPPLSPAGFSGRPALSPARSEVSAPSALVSHRQTVVGSEPAAASQLSRHRLASLVTERREKRSTAYRPVILNPGWRWGSDDLGT